LKQNQPFCFISVLIIYFSANLQTGIWCAYPVIPTEKMAESKACYLYEVCITA
jgi:hypothetical protein